jgi:hypothetical protein
MSMILAFLASPLGLHHIRVRIKIDWLRVRIICWSGLLFLWTNTLKSKLVCWSRKKRTLSSSSSYHQKVIVPSMILLKKFLLCFKQSFTNTHIHKKTKFNFRVCQYFRSGVMPLFTLAGSGGIRVLWTHCPYFFLSEVLFVTCFK